LTEKLPPATYETKQEEETRERSEVGRNLEGSETSSRDPEKGVDEVSIAPTPIDFPDGGWRAWR
jgi:hypothetical protein